MSDVYAMPVVLREQPAETDANFFAKAIDAVVRKEVGIELRGEQHDGQALPTDGAMSGDVPRSWVDKEIK